MEYSFLSMAVAKAPEPTKPCVARGDGGKGDGAAAAAEQRKEPREQKELRGRPRFAPEFDGLNCFETLITV